MGISDGNRDAFRTVKLTVRLTPLERDAFKALAALQGRSIAQQVRSAMAAEMGRHKATARWLERVLAERAAAVREMLRHER